MTTAQRLGEIIRTRGLIQARVAEKAGISPSLLSGIVLGKFGLREAYIPALAEALGLTAEQLRGQEPLPDDILKASPALREEAERRANMVREVIEHGLQPVSALAAYIALRADAGLRSSLGISDEELEGLGRLSVGPVADKQGLLALLMTLRRSGGRMWRPDSHGASGPLSDTGCRQSVMTSSSRPSATSRPTMRARYSSPRCTSRTRR